MLANRVKETTSTTGTGSFTTTGAATGFQTFNTAFGTDHSFYYWAVDETANTWECGIGYLSTSTILVRSSVRDNSSGGTTAFNFANAPSLFCAPIEESAYNSVQGMTTYSGSTPWVTGANIIQFSTTTHTADRLYYVPVFINFGGKIDGFKTDISTGAGTGANKIRMGLYSISPSGAPENLLFESANIDPSTTGAKAVAISDSSTQVITPGWYYVACASDVAVAVYTGVARTTISADCPLGGSTFRINTCVYETLGGSWTTLPTTIGTLTALNTNAPIALMRPA